MPLIHPGHRDAPFRVDRHRRVVDVVVARFVLPPGAALAAANCDFGAALEDEPGGRHRGEEVHAGMDSRGLRKVLTGAVDSGGPRSTREHDKGEPHVR